MTSITTAVTSSVLLEIFGFNSCDDDLPACIPWVIIGPFEGSKGGGLGFKMLSRCNGFISLGSCLGNSLGLTSKIGFSYFATGGNPLAFLLL